MKLNKRIKSSLIQTLFFNIFLLLILLGIIFSKFVPDFKIVEENKKSLSSAYSELQLIKQQGISLLDFKKYMNTSNEDDFLKAIVKSINNGFYNKNFINTVEPDFSTFISKKEASIIEEKKGSLVEKRNSKLSTILPLYSSNSGDGGITDFEFINYIESLLYTFNLVSNDTIGIGELKQVNASSISENSLDSNIFYIPLNIQLTGQKTDILDFIHYIENVGGVTFKDDELYIYNDKTISRAFPLESNISDYNIYKHQFSDIKSLSMDRYIDSSSDPVTGDFIDFIKTTQKRQRFSIEVDLRFYVQGLPDYKIENYIKEVLSLYSDLGKESQKALKLAFDEDTLDSAAVLKSRTSLRSLGNILKMMENDIKQLKISVSKKDTNLSSLYAEAQEYKVKLLKIKSVLDDSVDILKANN